MRATLSLFVLVVAAAAALAADAQAACDPFTTPPVFAGKVPPPREVIGIDLGERMATVAEVDALLAAIAGASDRVVLGTLPRLSVEGRALPYAVVSLPGNVGPDALERIRQDAIALQDPATPAADVERIARDRPAIVWIAGSVHGNEPSGCDAALRTLYELADRTDCAATQILNNTVVFILPSQNPDGREAFERRNANGFDMNRDWFARTQPEVDGKLEVAVRYPPVLFIDDHEMGAANYFFPPNSDPIYAEVSETSMAWINGVYGGAMAAEFDRQGIPYFNYDIYDLFYAGYGDQGSTVTFNAAGMTFEKNSRDAYEDKTYEQYVAQWTSVSQTAVRKQEVLLEWHASYVTAYEQGMRGALQPNRVYDPRNEVEFDVPADLRVTAYFVRNDDPSKAAEVATVVSRLLRVDVRVEQLTAPLTVRDFRAYGNRNATQVVLPAGTYAVTMAQGRKHLVQNLMNENTYVAFPYFYDVTGWSTPLLENTPGGWTGQTGIAWQADTLTGRDAERLLHISRAAPPAPARRAPVVAALRSSESPGESYDWLAFKLRGWGVPFAALTPADIAAGALEGVDVLVVPFIVVTEVLTRLGAAGRAAIVRWVTDDGGRLIGIDTGAALAAELGISSAVFERPRNECPGALFRINLDTASELAAGIGAEAFAFYSFMDVMTAPDELVVAAFPDATTRDFFASGYQEGAEELGGTAAVVDEAVGAGRVISFSFEVNFRAFTSGTSKLLLNAINADPATKRPAALPEQRARAEAAMTQRLAAPAYGFRYPIRVIVKGTGAGEHAAIETVLSTMRSVAGGSDVGAWIVVEQTPARLELQQDNPVGATWDAHAWLRRLPAALRRAWTGGRAAVHIASF